MPEFNSTSPAEDRTQPALAQALAALNARIVACELCPRLRAYGAEIGRLRRRAYIDQEYWARPVPSFGDPSARVLMLGLAPGAHGSNRTGRPFTGDGSGNFLFPILYEAGFASQPNSTSRNDGLTLTDLWISAAVRCAPPDNKPLPIELHNCAPYLDQELESLANLRVVVCLGKISFDAYITHLRRIDAIPSRRDFVFSHGAEFQTVSPAGIRRHLIATYHPSLQNTNTGRLTHAMFLRIFQRARELSELPPA